MFTFSWRAMSLLRVGGRAARRAWPASRRRRSTGRRDSLVLSVAALSDVARGVNWIAGVAGLSCGVAVHVERPAGGRQPGDARPRAPHLPPPQLPLRPRHSRPTSTSVSIKR